MTYPRPSMDVHVTGRRIVATLIDGFALGALIRFLAWILHVNVPLNDGDVTALSFNGSALTAVVVLIYYIGVEGFTGRTVGKLVTGIRVIGEDGGRPGFASGLVRTLLRIVDGFFGYLVAMIVVVNSDRRRRLGDMAAKTLVVRA